MKDRVAQRAYVLRLRAGRLCVNGPHSNDRWPKMRCTACAREQKLDDQLRYKVRKG